MLELLSVGRRPVRRILLAEDQDPSPQLDRIEELAARMRVPVETVPRARLDTQARTESPQGVVALAAPVEPVPLEDLCAPQRGTEPFLLVAAGITDPRNLGALLRSAECAGVTGVVLPKHRSARLSPTVAKTAAGALEHLSFAAVGGIPAALATLRELGVWSIGLAGEAEQSLYELPLGEGPVALVVGSEEKGLPPLVRKRCDARGGHPPTRRAAVAQRRRGRCGGLLRGGPPARRARRRLTYAAGVTSEVQKAQRWAATGISLRHWGHSRVSGSGSSLGNRFRRFISMLSGTTTAKKTTVATIRKDSSALMNAP